MRDRLYIEPLDPQEYYDQKPPPPGGWPKRTVPTIKDLDRAHDNLKKLVQEKDRIIEQANAQAHALDRERRWRKSMIAAFIATWTTILWILKLLVPYALKGLALR